MKKRNIFFWLCSLLLLGTIIVATVGCVPEPGKMTNPGNGLQKGTNNLRNLQTQQFSPENGARDSAKPEQKDQDIAPSQGEAGNKELKLPLYFGYSPNDRVERQIPATLGVGRAAIDQLIIGPQLGENKRKIVPDGTVLKSIRFEDGIMEANFSRELRDNHWGGIYEEYRTIYGIVNTLTEFPQVKQVRILVEGEKIKTISAGYVDLSQPLSRNMEITEDVISSRYLQLTREKPELRMIEWEKFVRTEAGQKKQLTSGQVLSAAAGVISGGDKKELVLTFKDYVEVWGYDRGNYRRLDKIDTPEGSCQALIGDVTGDGIGELLLFNSTNLYIYGWTGEKFEQQWWQGPVGGEIVNLYVEDADLDGRKDIVILRKQSQEKDNNKFINTIEIWQYNGTSFVKKMKSTEFPFFNMIVEQTNPGETVDIIGIGKSGIAAFNWNSQVYVERFRNPVVKGNIAIADTGLVCVDEMGMDVYFYHLSANGLEKKWQTGNLTGDRLAEVVAVADWDNDGQIETIISTNADGGYLVFYPEGDGYRHYIFREGNGRILLVDDLDGDGKQEIIFSYNKPGAAPAVYVVRLEKSLVSE
jgi:hypothetical protein